MYLAYTNYCADPFLLFMNPKINILTYLFPHANRQQMKSLRYVHERDVDSIKRLLELCVNRHSSYPEGSLASSSVTSTTVFNNKEPSTSINSEHQSVPCQPIGVISSWFPNKRGTPRQPVICCQAPGKLTLFKSIFTNPEHALQGLAEFSHMW